MSLPLLSTGSTLLSNTSNAATNLGSLILVVPTVINGLTQTRGYQPQNTPTTSGNPSTLNQPKTFLFDFEGEQSVELSSDITDNYIENNTSVQDQIALKPVKINTKGFVSELNNIPPQFLQPVKDVVQKLSSIGSYAPAISQTAQIAYDEAFFAYQTAISLANSAVGAWNSITNSATQKTLFGNEFNNNFSFNFPFLPTQTKQQLAFQAFYGYWISRTLFTIQTPWAVFANMAIERLRPVQSEDTQMYSTFECTFKQIRVASNILPDQSNVSQGRLAYSAQTVAGQGFSTPPVDISLSQGLTGPTSASFPTLFG